MSFPDNVEFDKESNSALVSINPKIYKLGVIFAAAYVLLEKAFIVLDGSPDDQIVASIKPKKPEGIEEIVSEFNEQLINFAVNFDQSDKTRNIREEFIKQAFITHSREGSASDEKCKN